MNVYVHFNIKFKNETVIHVGGIPSQIFKDNLKLIALNRVGIMVQGTSLSDSDVDCYVTSYVILFLGIDEKRTRDNGEAITLFCSI
jgi:hypothetical protein